MASFRRNNCECPKGTKCKCGAAWSYRIYANVNPKTGKRDQIERGGFRTEKEAKLAAYQAEMEIAHGTYIEEKNISFEDFAKEWHEIYLNSGNVKISTGRVRQHEINNLKYHFGKIPIKDITRSLYQKALNDLRKGSESKRGFALNTLDGIHRTGRMIFKKAVELEVIKTDPTKYVVVPKKQKTIEEIEKPITDKFLDKRQLITFLDAAKNLGMEDDYLVFMLLAYTGMRAGELCALKWSDIDFVNNTISITKTLYNPTNNTKNYTLLTPKTKTSVRMIEIDEVLNKVLEDHKARQKELRMLNRKTYHDYKNGFVYTKTTSELAGYPQQIKQIENRMKRLLSKCGLNEALSPHSLRHTHTSLLAELKINLEAIMERLGHKDDDTTRSVYLHITKESKKEAAHKFSELMNSLQGMNEG